MFCVKQRRGNGRPWVYGLIGVIAFGSAWHIGAPAAARSAGAPAVPPIGARVDALADPFGGIRVAGIGPNDVYARGGLSLLALDRRTLQVRTELGVPATPAGADGLERALADLAPGALVIVSGPHGLTGGAAAGLASALERIGARVDAGRLRALAPFSAIGVVGWRANTAWVNVADPFRIAGGHHRAVGALRPRVSDGRSRSVSPAARSFRPHSPRHHRLGLPPSVGARGDLSGYLQSNPSTGAYGFVFSDAIAFDTRSAYTARSNTMQIGAASYTASFASDIPPGSAGFHVVIVDPSSLNPLRDLTTGWELNEAWPVNTGNPQEDAIWQNALAGRLQEAADAGALVFMQSIASPRPTTSAWTQIAQAVERLGGTRTVINELDGTGGYALVGDASGPQAAEATHDPPADRVVPDGYRTGQRGRLSGLLGRDRRADFRPLLWDPSGQLTNTDFTRILYQPPSEWPLSHTPTLQATNRYIADALKLPNRDDVRANYTDDVLQWADESRALSGLSYPAGSQAFSREDFEALKRELLDEFAWVNTIKKGLIPAMEKPYQLSALTNPSALARLADDVRRAASTPPDTSTQVQVLQAIQQLTQMAAEYFSPAEAKVSRWFYMGVQAYTEWADNAAGVTGEALLGKITIRSDQLAEDLARRYKTALVSLDLDGDILVSDYAKLKAAYDKTRNDPDWSAGTTSAATAASELELSARRLFYEALLPTVYMAWPLPGASSAGECRYLYYWDDDLYFHEPATAQIRLVDKLTATAPAPQPLVVTWALSTKGANRRANRHPPPASLTDPLFKPISPDDPTALGMFKPWFFTPRVLETTAPADCSDHP